MAGKSSTGKTKTTLRFAHPFFTTTPVSDRKTVAGVGSRMTDFIKDKLDPVPRPHRSGRLTLDDLLGVAGTQDIQTAGALRFHAFGDSGRRPDSPQQWVAEAMATDYDAANPGRSPGFLFHLGDVVYGPGKDQGYRREFYEPYKPYPGKIIAIAGNHDGESFPDTDPKPLAAFMANFCASTAVVPEVAGSVFRQTMTLPGVYWLLEAPFVDILGLYSNSAENPGYISGDRPGQAQKQWLVKMLKRIQQARQKTGTRKALVIATHHPPFCAGGHSGSAEMLADFDDAFKQAGVQPDVFLSGHAHSYQRYNRTVTVSGQPWQSPYIVAGTGGVGAQGVPTANGEVVGDHQYVSSYKGYGFLLLTAMPGAIESEFFAVDQDPVTSGPRRTSKDKVHVDLATHTLS